MKLRRISFTFLTPHSGRILVVYGLNIFFEIVSIYTLDFLLHTFCRKSKVQMQIRDWKFVKTMCLAIPHRIFFKKTFVLGSYHSLKYRSSNLTFSWRTPSHYHIFLQFLSHFGEKKISKRLGQDSNSRPAG